MVDLNNVQKWLQKCNCYDTKKVRITLGNTTYDAVEYYQERMYSDGNQLINYIQHCIYVPGKLPVKNVKDMPKYIHNGIVWMLGCYLQDESKLSKYAEFHPFGINFLLMDILPVSEGIRDYRASMTIEYLE